MTLSGLIARWFGRTFSNLSPASGPSPLIQAHYEEDDDDYGDDDEPEDEPSDDEDEDVGPDSFLRPSSFTAVYEEDAAHRQEEAELDEDELGEPVK